MGSPSATGESVATIGTQQRPPSTLTLALDFSTIPLIDTIRGNQAICQSGEHTKSIRTSPGMCIIFLCILGVKSLLNFSGSPRGVQLSY